MLFVSSLRNLYPKIMKILYLTSSPGAEHFPDGCGNVLWSLQNQYEKHKEVEAAQGVKILGKDLEKTLAGLPLLVAHKEDEIPVLKVSCFSSGTT